MCGRHDRCAHVLESPWEHVPDARVERIASGEDDHPEKPRLARCQVLYVIVTALLLRLGRRPVRPAPSPNAIHQ